MTEIKLLPCPFCGGRAYLEKHHRAFIDGVTSKVAFVRCTVCNARSGRVNLSDYGRTSHSNEANRKAIEAWNRRADEEAIIIPKMSDEDIKNMLKNSSPQLIAVDRTNKWFSVDERLPQESEVVLAYSVKFGVIQ